MLALHRICASLLFSLLLLHPLGAAAWNRGAVDRFATLPAGTAYPEGIAIDAHGDVYVTSFDLTGSPPGKVTVFDAQGKLKRQLKVSGSSNLLLGIEFHPLTGELLVVDFGNARVLRVDKQSGAASVFSQPTGAGGLNAMTFDRLGNVYVSDSFRGTVWRIDATGGVALDWVTHPLLAPLGNPPFGANGMGFNAAQSSLFVANTGDDRLIRVPVSGAGAAGTPEVFVNGINGADGVLVDADDNIWVTANQADEIVVVDKSGRAIAKLGDFDGVRHGAPVGLLLPASLALRDGWLYITNLALDLRLAGAGQAVDSQWAAKVSSYTISRLRARIPRHIERATPGDPDRDGK